MKTFNSKFKFAMLPVIAALLLMLVPQKASAGGAFQYLVNGPLYTNYNATYNASPTGTNTSGTITNNFQVGVVPGASNILWQLSSVNGGQPYLGTNGYLPAAVYNSDQGYPGTLYGPNNLTTIMVAGSLMATNASSTAIVFNFAASIDGTLWQTNFQTITTSIPVNTTSITNVPSVSFNSYGFNYIALQQINNPGVAALTNVVIEINGKPGL